MNMSVSEAAVRAGVSDRTMQNWFHKHAIGFWIGGRMVIERDRLVGLLIQQRDRLNESIANVKKAR